MKGRTFAAAEGEWYFESEEDEQQQVGARNNPLECSAGDSVRLPSSPFEAEEVSGEGAGVGQGAGEGEGPRELSSAQIVEMFERAEGLQEVMRKCGGFPEWLKRVFWRLHYLLGERIMDVQEFLIRERVLEGSLKLEVPDIETVACRLVEKALNEWEDEQFKQMKKNMHLLYNFAAWQSDIAVPVYNYCVKIWRQPLAFRLHLKYMSKEERQEVERLYALGVIDSALLEKARALNLPNAATPDAFLQVKEAIKRAKIAADIAKSSGRDDKEKEKHMSKQMFTVDRIPEGKMGRVKPNKPWNYEYISESTVGKEGAAGKPSLYKPPQPAHKRPIHLNYESTEPREINPLASASVGNSMVIIPGERVSKKILVIEQDDPEELPQARKEGKSDWNREEERTLCEIYREAETLEECMRQIDRQMSVDPRWRNSEQVELRMRAISCRVFSRFDSMKSSHTNNNANVLCFRANRALVIACSHPELRHALYRQIAALHLYLLDRPTHHKREISRAIIEINNLCKRIHKQY